jgi:hypothetical protein
LGLVVDARDALCPCEGGVLELSGVFGGKSSLARRLAFSAPSAAFCASNTVSRLLNSSIRASNDAISASFSALDRQEESGGAVTHTLTHILPPDAIAFMPIESICRTNNAGQTRGLSNYAYRDPKIRRLPSKIMLSGCRLTLSDRAFLPYESHRVTADKTRAATRSNRAPGRAAPTSGAWGLGDEVGTMLTWGRAL